MEVVDVDDHGVVPLPPQPGNYEPELIFDPRQRARVHRAPRRRPADRDHPARGPELHRRRPRGDAGRSGSCGSASPRARAWCCTRSATRTAAGCGRSSTARRCRRCSSPTATRRRRTGSRTCSTWASSASAGWPTRSTLGCDCLGEIHYFDGVVNDQDGEPVTIPNAICMHEEDVGIAWKHTDFRTETVEVRRCAGWSSRRSPPSATTSTASSGTSTTTARSSTRSSSPASSPPGAIAAGETPAHGTLVAPGLYGPHHQHFFCVRLDMSVDGAAQHASYEVDSVPSPPGPDNPHGNAWVTRRTLLASESEAPRDVDAAKARFWQIDQPVERQRARPADRLQADAGGDRAADGAARTRHLRPRAGSPSSTCG